MAKKEGAAAQTSDPYTPTKDDVVDVTALEQQAIGIVRRERTTWENATAFITEKVAFQMRNLIRQLRKNYWGVFDEQYDPTTGRRKIWVPLTEATVESVVKNIDLDTKDLNFRAKKPEKAQFASLVRAAVKNYLDDTYFGEDLDDGERRCAIDGTLVWKTYDIGTQTGSRYDMEKFDASLGIKRVAVDLLNVYIDPTAPSIHEAYRFTERSLFTVEEVQAMASEGWLHTDGLEGTEGLARNDATSMSGTATQGTTNRYVDVWELWGKIPKNLMTGKEEDRRTEVDGHIIVSGLDKGTQMRCHLIEEYDGIKPYEEGWYTRVPGRWYGKGIAEKLIWLQLWINTIVNIRINRSYVSQLGIFKVKRNAGVTPQMLSRLAANGVLMVNDLNDIEQMAVQEASMASYKDEDLIQGWAERVTSAFEVVTGEMLPSSTPATNAVLQNRNAQSQFVLIKEGFGMFLQRWVKRQLLPRMIGKFTKGYILRLTGDPEALRAIDEQYVDAKLAAQVDDMTKAGKFVRPDEVLFERDRMIEQLKLGGDHRHIELDEDIDPTEYDVQVFVTNEEVDKGVLAQNLLTALQSAPEYRDQILTSVFDIMGVGPFRAPRALPVPMGMPGEVPGQMVSPEQVQAGVQAQPGPQSAVQQMVSANQIPVGR